MLELRKKAATEKKNLTEKESGYTGISVNYFFHTYQYNRKKTPETKTTSGVVKPSKEFYLSRLLFGVAN